MNPDEAERRVRRYDQITGDPTLGEESTRDLAALQDHIGRWWGEGTVFHEIISEFVHIDLHFIPPGPQRPFQTIITTSMSDRPMQAPAGHEHARHGELLLCLPPEWKIDGPEAHDEAWWWPLRHLKQTARFPHIYNTWLWHTHTVGNGNELAPVGPGLPFVGFVLDDPKLSPPEAHRCRIDDEKTVHFHALIPLHEAELRFAWQHGSLELFKHLADAGVDELIRPDRACVLEPPRKPSLADRLRRGWPWRKRSGP